MVDLVYGDVARSQKQSPEFFSGSTSSMLKNKAMPYRMFSLVIQQPASKRAFSRSLGRPGASIGMLVGRCWLHRGSEKMIMAVPEIAHGGYA